MRRFITFVCFSLAVLGCSLIVLVSIVAVGNALSRGLFGASIYGANDLLTMITFVGIIACFPLAMRERVHMRVTVLGDVMPLGPRLVIETFAGLLTLGFLAALALRFFVRAGDLTRYGEVSDIARVPLAPWWWVGAVLLAVSALVQLWVIVDNPRHYAEKAHSENGARND